jgi:membrane protease YdiL (CAAX protease family)
MVYCILISRQQRLFVKSNLMGENWRNVSMPMAIRFSGFVIVSSVLVWQFLPEVLFSVVIANPWLWLAVSLFYVVFSVYPQEFLYRLFFFKRYQKLVSNQYLFIGLNAVLFSLAHSFLHNDLVLLLTFVGGILFAITYKKSQSLMLASIEHSAYGIWLFTLGLGQQLAFPVA